MLKATVNGIEISYADSAAGADPAARADPARAGGDDAPVVLLSHGYLMDHSMFEHQVAALAPEFRVITWDERGFGDTPAPGPFSYWDSAADVLGLLDHLGIRQAVLGGMSQGGFLSLRAALLAPERVRALILLDSQAGLEDPAELPAYEQMEAVWRERGPEPVQEVVASIILGPGSWDDWYAKWAGWNVDGLTHAFRCLVDRDDITGRLAEIRCPALVVHGTSDAAIPMERARELARGLGGPAHLVEIDGGPHAANLTHPAQVNAAILPFLRGLA